MDVGPLGYLAIAAHGHADALAITLAHDGRELVVDPGTGSYYSHPDSAHRAPGHPDARHGERGRGGPVGDGRRVPVVAPGRVTVRRVDLAAGEVCAEHDGYTAAGPPVTHRR